MHAHVRKYVLIHGFADVDFVRDMDVPDLTQKTHHSRAGCVFHEQRPAEAGRGTCLPGTIILSLRSFPPLGSM